MKIYTLTTNEEDISYAMSAVQNRSNAEVWQVVKHDMTDWTGSVSKLKKLEDAYQEFLETDSTYSEERIDLMFVPNSDDEDFKDKIVVNFKLFKGGERFTPLEQKIFKYFNNRIDNDCEWHGPEVIIRRLLNDGFTKEELISLNFDGNEIDDAIENIKREEKDYKLSKASEEE